MLRGAQHTMGHEVPHMSSVYPRRLATRGCSSAELERMQSGRRSADVCARCAPGGKHSARADEAATSVEGITEYRLPNGLRILLYPDDSTSRVTVNLTVFAGSRNEGYGETQPAPSSASGLATRVLGFS